MFPSSEGGPFFVSSPLFGSTPLFPRVPDRCRGGGGWLAGLVT